jgi:hypothetical protein
VVLTGEDAAVLIPSSVLNLHTICSEESIRYALNGVLFQRDPGGACCAAASCTRRLLVARWDENDAHKDGPAAAALLAHAPAAGVAFSRLVPADVVADLAKLLGEPWPVGTTNRGWLSLEEPAADPDRYRLAVAQRRGVVEMAGPCSQGRFPPWRELLGALAPAGAAGCRIDPHLLGTLAAALEAVTGGESVKMAIVPPNGPIRLESDRGAGAVVSATGLVSCIQGN